MKTRIYLLVLLFSLVSSAAFSQGGAAINENGLTADPSAMLDVYSTDKGILIPRMTEAEKNAIVLPANGLLVYQTDGVSGFYYFNGTAWLPMTGGGGGSAPSNLNFTMTINEDTLYAGAATSTSWTNLWLSWVSGDASQVTMSCTGLPAGVVAEFTPMGGYLNLSPQFRLNVGPAVTPGNYTLTVVATGGAAPVTLDVVLVVLPVKYLFATSTAYNGNLGGIAGADAKCMAHASNAGLTGTFKAWVSTPSYDAINVVQDACFVYPDGTVAALGKKAIFNTGGMMNFSITKNEYSQQLNWGDKAWTATNNAGTYTGESCNSWTSDSWNTYGHYGWWSQGCWSYCSWWGADPCDASYVLYCFEQ